MSKNIRNWIKWCGVVASLAILISLVALIVFLYTSEPHSDKLGAIAAIFGGALGAAGAALAVYLTIAGQRSDEAEKVESTLRMEAAEFGRQALGRLQICEEILAKQMRIPMSDLLAMMPMPEAVVYKATADRISRLPYGALFVAFHARIAEAVSIAAMTAAKKTPQESVGRPMPAMIMMVDEGTARILLTAWFDVCEIARSILRPAHDSDQIAKRVEHESLADLDAAHERVRSLVKSEG